MKTIWAAAVAGGLLGGLVGFAQTEPAPGSGGAAGQVAASMPASVPMLSDAEYEKRRPELVGGLRRRELSNDARPLVGLKVTGLTQDAPAKGLGIRVDNVITKVDGAVATPTALHAANGSGAGFEVTVFQPGAGAKTVQCPAGMLGIYDETLFVPAEVYWRRCAHDPRWDDDLLVAATHWKEPAVALAALKRAESAGCNSPMAPALRAMIAWREDAYGAALAYGVPALKALPAEAAGRVVQAMEQCAVGLHDYAQAQSLAAMYPDWLESKEYLDAIGAAKAYEEGLPAALRLKALPVRVAKEVGTVDWSGKLENVRVKENPDDEATKAITYSAAEWLKHKPFHLDAPAGSYQKVAIGPGLKDAEFYAQFTCKPHDHNASDYGHAVSMTLEDYDAAKKATTIVFRVSLTPDLTVHVESAGMPECILRKPQEKGMATRRMRIVVVGQRAQVLINGESVWDGPFVVPEEKRKLVGMFYAVGYSAWLTGLEWQEVKYEAPAGVAAPVVKYGPLDDFLMRGE